MNYYEGGEVTYRLVVSQIYFLTVVTAVVMVRRFASELPLCVVTRGCDESGGVPLWVILRSKLRRCCRFKDVIYLGIPATVARILGVTVYRKVHSYWLVWYWQWCRVPTTC